MSSLSGYESGHGGHDYHKVVQYWMATAHDLVAYQGALGYYG